ncbi:hypothetical protein DE146DRAFT_51293 [Phaeosphaeria sp. MPI-PUGE-AT-0046c]|nr:hypothetical protein DE146DRAFT_51293 [Phaeosphaeria sp. MPI-PUGE-AT-0046c]
MLRAFTERRDSSQPSPTQEKSKTWVPSSSSKQNGVAKPKSNHKRKSSAKPKVVFKSQMSGPSGSQAPRTRTAVTGTSQIDTNTTPVSKRHKAFASLLVSFLATSSVAIEPDAADEKTIESANKASSTPLPPAPKKAHTRSASVVKPSEIRKTRWKRFKYELGLKMKTGQKGKQKQEATQPTEMELVDMEAQKREQARQEARRVGTA